jgi:hypothetical protein
MWKPMLVAAAALAMTPALAAAAAIGPVASLHVTAGPALLADTKVLDARDADQLTESLRRSVQRSLDKAHAVSDQGGVLDIQLVKARPTRPTMTQMSHRPGLSMQSLYTGGMDVTGTYTARDGAVTPIKFHWEAFDLRDAQYGATWTDAERGFDRFAISLTRG